MKTILVIFFLLPLTLGAAILHVALDGSQAYSSVQSAVHAAVEMDTILIHPGNLLREPPNHRQKAHYRKSGADNCGQQLHQPNRD